MISTRTLILASASPRRQELIASFNLPFEIMVSQTEETVEPGLSPAEVVESLSLQKARDVLLRLSERNESVIIGSDTIVVFEGQVFGKPQNEQEAFQMLKQLQGNTHEVYTGIACVDAGTKKAAQSHRVTRVTMRGLSDEQIWRYIRTGEPMDKAGAYGIQGGLGAAIVTGIEGDFFNVVGLPLSLLSDMLLEFGLEVI